MIRLDRSVVAVPADADWTKVVAAAFADHGAFLKKARSFEKLPIDGAQRRKGFRAYAKVLAEFKKGAKGFPEVWVDAKASRELAKMTDGFCAYCQTDVESGQHGDTEHFCPKSLFPLLAYCWTNWFYACRSCNHAKGNKWPAKVRWVAPDDKRRDPARRFVFKEDGTVQAARRDRGAAQTIEDFRFNRKGLVKQRKKLIEAQMVVVRRSVKTIRDLRALKSKSTKVKALIRMHVAALDALKIDARSRFGAAVSQCVERELRKVKL